MLIKICSKCNKEKTIAEFYKNKGNLDGLTGHCKDCIKEYNKLHKEDRDRNNKAFKEKNPEYFQEYEKTEQRKSYLIDYRDKEKPIIFEKICSKCNKLKPVIFFQQNITKKDGYNTQCKSCEIENKKIYNKHKRKTDPLFKLRCNISTLIGNSIRNGGFKKSSKTFNYLQCTFAEFQLHIEKQFTEGMTWDNYGEWEYDHIYPVSLAENEEHLVQLNHYTNFQPLWKVDNIRKGNKINNINSIID